VRPKPIYLDQQWDWDGFYEPFSKKFQGFTRSATNPTAVHAFKLERAPSGIVRLHYRESAAFQQGLWRGVNGELGEDLDQGFDVFKVEPQGVPRLITPNPHPVSLRRQASVLNPRVVRAMEVRGMQDSVVWLRRFMETGQPTISNLQPRIVGEIGCKVEVGQGQTMHWIQGH
jgi:hypothetical protein